DGVTQPLPVVLFFTTYSEGPGDADFAKEAADHGYVGIVAYSRGIRTDIKQYTPYLHDGEDADDVIDWISKQPWCDGKVGMFGGSYTGFVQWSAVRHPPAALKTIVPQVAVMPGFDFPMENNVHMSFAIGWANSILGYPKSPDDLNQVWYQKGAAFADLDRLAGQRNPLFQTWLDHPAYDSYWRSLVPTPEEYADLHIPILVTDGYYDGAQIAETQYVRKYLQYNPHPDLYLVIGPYDHFGAQRPHPKLELSGYRIDPVADVSMRGLVYQWFDYVLKGAKKPAILADRINYEVMGADEWHHASDLQQMHNRLLTFYLSARKENGNHLLDPHHPDQEAGLPQTVDFTDRATQNNYFTPLILLDKLDSSNGLVFETAPFDHDFSIDGSFAGSLTAAIDKQDMDVSIAFYQQMPDGKYFYLTRYLGRASYAQDRGHRQLLKPGVKTTLPLNETSITSRKIVKGSRLVIVLNVNKHPYDEINYGSGGNISDESMKDAGKPLQIRWFNDSYITVPVQE
ncbi:MAG TPA: CocE/NonD family hydrolase, partial [Holophagaceae bacterium]|nr:CocE/NonD family hydrolase [Holophagaceae bacterium]